MRNVTILLAVVAVLALAGPAWAGYDVFQVTSGNWNVAGNWSGGIPTSQYNTQLINNNRTATVATAATSPGELYVGHTHDGDLIINADFAQSSGATKRFFIGHNAGTAADPASVTQNSGNVTFGYYTDIGEGSDAYGLYTISGGSLTAAGYLTRLANGSTAHGTFRVEGGWHIDTTGDKAISIATLQMLNDNATLEFDMENDSNPIQTINVGAVTLDGNITVTGSAPANTWYTLLSWTGTATDNAFSVNLPDSNWSWNSGSYATDKEIKVQYVPEPATMLLLTVGGIGVLIRRKRR